MRGTTTLHNLGLLFDRIVAAHGDAPALRPKGDADVSYAALDARANRTARVLAAHGCRRGDVLGVLHDKTVAAYAAMLACLKLGVTYANVDAANPASRLEHVFATAAPRMLLAFGDPGESVQGAADGLDIPLLDLDAHSEAIAAAEASPLAESRSVTGSTPAYLMFTSGSTGQPKGVVVTHDNVAAFVEWAQAEYGIGPGDVLTGVNPPYFDNSVFDFYAALFNGACLAPVSPATVDDPRALIDAVEAARCTVWFSVPSLLIYLGSLKLLRGSRLPDLRVITFGGEGYPKSELIKLWRAFGDRVRIVNVYGPTECTCICSAFDITEATFADMEGVPPLGHLAVNFDGLLLDGDTPVADGEAGELCLLGPGVAAGYYRMPERTDQSFVQNPLNGAYREPMYRTGDLVRRSTEDGLLYFVGRADNQIKHMGYRIELEEIEAALAAIEEVTEAAVVYQRVRATHGHILAFLAGDGIPDENTLRERLRERLPGYMIPNRIHVRAMLPKNANGKVDRVALSREPLVTESG